ncbi:MAG: DNA repair protein RecN [Acidimicrobiia bacterium]|nr:DNA repair protein RecN [Acidimicrobiia bacterium]MYC57843.1 DNA repair protein RecN [Acidimicrobiia bacterium]MYI30645.1 DNA repair protein RecN [Acidimicrobiia bacterium]
MLVKSMQPETMLVELSVENLGVIGQLSLVLTPGMTALTGETGAGKTLVVTALDLLLGGRAESTMVRHGADEAVVEGRFFHQGEEIVLCRVVPANGRARAYVNGRLASASALATLGSELVDLHGQHAHQSLLKRAHQRAALDSYGKIDLAPLNEARSLLAEVERHRAVLGGDERARAREVELCRYQLQELDEAALEDPSEEEGLKAEEALLSDVSDTRDAARGAAIALGTDGAVGSELAHLMVSLEGRVPLQDQHERLMGLVAELADVSTALRLIAEGIEENPARLVEVRQRRELLLDLRRKYGETLGEVMAFYQELANRLKELEDCDRLGAELDAEHQCLVETLAQAAATVGAARRDAAEGLAEQVTARLRDLAMPRAEVQVTVGDDPGDEVDVLLAANSGAPGLRLDLAASGGELARVMLALRLVISAGPPVLVFDEVDAGIGGQVAQKVGQALLGLTAEHQVLVVTHLPQVAACADNHVSIVKHDDGSTTSVTVELLEGEQRIVELSRMLSGSPDSETARRHASELLGLSKR